MPDETNKMIIEDSSEFSSRVKLNYEKLSASEKRVAQFLLENEIRCQELTIYQMAKEIDTSVATITRFCQMLGYRGLADMKFNLQRRTVNFVSKDMGIRQDDSINTIKQKALQFTQSAMQDCIYQMDNNDLGKAINFIGEAGNVMLCGIGSASGVVHTGVGLFLTAGIRAFYVSDTLLQLRNAANLGPSDVLIAISYDGYAKDMGDAMMMAKGSGARTILISSVRNSLLGQYADIQFFTPARSMGNALSITATSICQLAVLQSLMVGTVSKYYDKLAKNSATQLHLSELKRYDHKQAELHVGRVRL